MMNKLKHLCLSGLDFAGIHKLLISRNLSKNKVSILNFHQISPYENHFWPPLKPDVFDKLLAFLKQHFDIRLFSELSIPAKDKPIAIISFDDGYYDFVEFALPILEKHDIRVNMNIIPSCVKSGVPIWNVLLYDFLQTASIGLVNEIKLPRFGENLFGDSPSAKLSYGLKVSNFLKNRAKAERAELWLEIERVMAKHEFKKTKMMSLEDVLDISKKHEVGVHSFSHESMGYEDDEFFQADLSKCFEYFDKKLSLPMDIYAFPNGSYRPEQIDLLLQKGIKRILLVDEDFASVNENVFRRFTMYGPSYIEAKFQALGMNALRKSLLI